MTSISHMAALEQRHQSLKQQIILETQRASVDDQKIRDLKRKKLELKDQIARLEKEIRH